MSGSTDEKEMRVVVTSRLRMLYPSARIVEELPVKCGAVDRRADLMAAMAWHMTGREITLSVCRQLRGRAFAAGDPPMTEVAP